MVSRPAIPPVPAWHSNGGLHTSQNPCNPSPCWDQQFLPFPFDRPTADATLQTLHNPVTGVETLSLVSDEKESEYRADYTGELTGLVSDENKWEQGWLHQVNWPAWFLLKRNERTGLTAPGELTSMVPAEKEWKNRADCTRWTDQHGSCWKGMRTQGWRHQVNWPAWFLLKRNESTRLTAPEELTGEELSIFCSSRWTAWRSRWSSVLFCQWSHWSHTPGPVICCSCSSAGHTVKHTMTHTE